MGLIEALEARNLVCLAEVIIRAALMREESRSAHYRTDFPNRDDKRWLKNIVVKKQKEDMSFTTVSPIITKIIPADTEEVE